MKILITGATGFIGQHLVKELSKQEHELHVLVRALTNLDPLKNVSIKPYVLSEDIDDLISFMKQEKFDGVIHLASLFLARHEAKDIKSLIDSNVFFGATLLEACTQAQAPWFINTGTFWQHYENKLYSPVNLYAATKQALEDIIKYYVEAMNLNVVTIKLSDTFGPSDTRPKIFTLWSNMVKTNEKLDMSPGEQLIDISYIDNVIDGFVRMVNLMEDDKERAFAGKSFAIKSSQRMTLKKLAETFEKVTGKKLNINWGGREYRPREVMVPWEKGETIPGWEQKVSIEEGIKRTLDIK